MYQLLFTVVIFDADLFKRAEIIVLCYKTNINMTNIVEAVIRFFVIKLVDTGFTSQY